MPFSSALPASIGLGSGDSASLVAGTGISGPPGVEAVLTYNSITMNVRNWLETYIINSIDGLADADVRDQREVNPQQHGETALDAFYGGRTVVLNGKIRAFSLDKMRDMQQALREAFADLTTEMPLIFHAKNSNYDLVLNCKKAQPIAMVEQQTNFNHERDFQVTLRASNPRFVSRLTNVQTTLLAPVTNLYANPSGEVTLKGNGTQTGFTTTREASGTNSVNAYAGAWRDKHVYNGGGSNGWDAYTFTAPAAGTYVASVYVWIPATWSGAMPQLTTDGSFTGGTIVSQTPANSTIRGQWQRICMVFTVVAGDLSGNVVGRFTAAHTPINGVDLFYSDAVQIEAGSAPTRYFDGSSAGAVWNGAANASSSTYTGDVSMTTVNNGNFPAQPSFDLTGPLTNPKISNDLTGEFIQINGTIPNGEMWTFDTTLRRFRNQAGVNKFGTLDATSGWPEARPGSNAWTISATGRGVASALITRLAHTYI